MNDDREVNDIAEEQKKQIIEDYLSQNEKKGPGDSVTGVVYGIMDDKVIISVSGTKKEIEKSKVDFVRDFGCEPEEGQKIDGVLRYDSKTSGYQLYKSRDVVSGSSSQFKEAEKNRTPVLGTFIRLVSTKKDDSSEEKLSGYDVKLNEDYTAFCPLSKSDVEYVNKPEELLGVSDYFIIEKFHESRRQKSIVNRREYLQSQIDIAKKEFFDSVAVGDVVEGTVKSINNFGAFVNLGGFDGLLHIGDMSWGHVAKAKNFVKKGDVLRLRVLSFDKENSKVNLSLKDMQENPWNTFAERYSVGQVVKGTVVRVTNFGIFVEIEPGIEGLAHVSEISWSKKKFNPATLYHVKDVVEAKILGYDLDNERISLGIRELIENPWDSFAVKFPVGTKLNAEAVKVVQNGAFFKITDDIDGFLSVDDVSWTEKIDDMKKWVKEGESREVMIFNIDTKNQRVKLSVKALSSDPWQVFADSHQKGSVIQCKIESITDKGVNVKVNDDISGLIFKKNLNIDENERMENKYKSGDEISAVIVELNPKQNKLVLSEKEFARREALGDYEKYMQNVNDDDASTGYTLGDILSKDEDNE